MHVFLVSAKFRLLSNGKEGEILQLQNLYGKTLLIDLGVYGTIMLIYLFISILRAFLKFLS
jgi:hypothetical protein